jgi:RNA recognition motif-containing protein
MHKNEDAAPVFKPQTSPFYIRSRDTARHNDRSPFTPPQGPDAHAVYVGDLPVDVTAQQIRDVLSGFGNIDTVNILRKDVEDGK